MSLLPLASRLFRDLPMEMFEYVAVLTSIVIGLGITHLLQGVAPGRFLGEGVGALLQPRHGVVLMLAYQVSWALRLFERVG